MCVHNNTTFESIGFLRTLARIFCAIVCVIVIIMCRAVPVTQQSCMRPKTKTPGHQKTRRFGQGLGAPNAQITLSYGLLSYAFEMQFYGQIVFVCVCVCYMPTNFAVVIVGFLLLVLVYGLFIHFILGVCPRKKNQSTASRIVRI